MEGPIYFFGPTTFIKCMVPLYAQFYFFCLTFLMELIFYVSFSCCCVCVCVCVLFFVLLFGNYGNIFQNFDNFFEITPKT